MSSINFDCIMNILNSKADECMKQDSGVSTRKNSDDNKSHATKDTMVILKELVKQIMEYTDVNVQELRDEIKARDVRIDDLVEENSELRYQVDALAQYNRRDNLKIVGLKYDKDEDVYAKVKEFTEHIGAPVKPEEISTIHRLQSGDARVDENATAVSGNTVRIPNTIVKLVHRDVKTKIFNARKQNVDKPGSPYPDAVIYEDVTPLRSRIMYQLRNRKDTDGNKMWKFVWSRDGRIFCRTEEESRQTPQTKPHVVNRVEDLRKLQFSESEIKDIICAKRH